jgi:hypothetical protein
MPETEINATSSGRVCAYRILRYTPNLIRDEWINIGVLLFDPATGERRLRLIAEQEEYARLRRWHPTADEDLVRGLQEDLEDRFRNVPRAASGRGVQELVAKWDDTLSNILQLAPQKGVYADDLDAELERLYADHVAPPRKAIRVGAPGSRAAMRDYCDQVWKQAQLWGQVEKSVRVEEFTFPGDPLRIDYCYRQNGTRGYVQTLSVSRALADSKLYAYTAARIAARAPFASEFTAVTDVQLQDDNKRHRFVRDTLRDAQIEPVPMVGFAVWVAKLKSQIH